MGNKSGGGFLLTTKFYKVANDVSLFVPEKRKTGEETTVHPGGTAVKKQENTTTKHIETRKIHPNELHTKIVHPGEDRMRATAKHLQYIIEGELEVCEGFSTAKSKQKLLHKVAEERDLKIGKMIYLDFIS